MIITVEQGEDTHYLDTERKPFMGGVPTFCGFFELSPEQMVGVEATVSCVKCRHVSGMSREVGKGVLVPYPKKKK